MNKNIIDLFEISPVIAAIKDDEGLKAVLKSQAKTVFLLYGNICNISEIVKMIKDTGKTVIVHMDFIVGLNSKEISVDYIKNNTVADGIMSTKSILLKRGMELGLIAGQRAFIFDSISFANIKKQLDTFKPDFLEILPGTITKVIDNISKHTSVPIVAGGLLTDKRDVMDAFTSGASAVSTTKVDLWEI